MHRFWRRVWEVVRSLDADAHLVPDLGLPTSSAKKHGLQLLVRNLSPSQRDQFEHHDYFDVVGGETGACYRIRYGQILNVERLDENGRRLQLLCFGPKGKLPIGDVMLAQKLALELFESEAFRVANLVTLEYGREFRRSGGRIGRHRY
jgi:hypothetical protein